MNIDWKDILKNVAPVIGGTIGGPFGAIGMKFLAGMLLGNENATEQEIADAVVGASPEQLAQIRKWDNDFKVKMAELGFKEQELHVRDRESARQLAEKNMTPQIILSTVYTIGYILVLWAFVSGKVEINSDVKAEFNMVLGAMTAAQVQIMNFWFGSSAGSKSKTAALLPH